MLTCPGCGDDPTDRLHVLAHAWGARTATPLRLRADNQAPVIVIVIVIVIVAVAEPGPLIAMKLQSVMNRGRAEEATDLLDIIQLTLHRTTGPAAALLQRRTRSFVPPQPSTPTCGSALASTAPCVPSVAYPKEPASPATT